MKEWMEAAAGPKQEKATSGKTKVEIAPLRAYYGATFVIYCCLFGYPISAERP